MKNKPSFFLLHIFLPLLLGSLAYFLLRAEAILLLDWLYIQPVYTGNGQETNFLYQILAYNLADALWLYAFLATLSLIWAEDPTRRYWQIGIYILAIISEIAQYYQIINGTGDWADVMAYSLAFFIFYFIIQKQQQ